MKKLLLVVVALSLLLIQTVQASTPKDTLVMAFNIDEIISLDPAEIFEFANAEYAANAYDRLINYDVDHVSEIYPGIAERWEISDDGLTYIFKIRKGVSFASGNTLSADDVVFSLRRVVLLDKSPAFILTQFGFTPENVKRTISKVDEYTVKIIVDKAYAPTFFLYCLTSTAGSVVDKKEVLAHEKDGDLGYGWLKTGYAGSGPYRLRTWKASELIILDANKHYWGGAPKLNRIVIRHIVGSAGQRMLLEKGDIDMARNLTVDDLKSLETNKDIKIQTRAKGAIYYLGLNQKNKYLRIPEVRQAFKYLIDYKGIEQTILSGKATVHQAFLPKGFLGALEETPFFLDIEKAKALLKKVGLENGFTVTMDTRNTEPVTSIALSIQSTFAKAGIKLEIIPGDGKQTLTKYRARNHDIFIIDWGPDYMDPHTNASTFARNPDNSDDAKFKTLAWRNAWDIPQMTQKADAAVLERDTAKRVQMYQDLQREHQQTSPFVIMFQNIEVVAERANVEHFILGPSFDSNFYRYTTK
ncbi:ABC transporter substrate-binding protein [uncultured Desulfobacter sp.]|uniref:ABC transporter substrate-binding protein n=1 Tax=uncultured Desulfobacter sp. TaxID=240139 RepID=UPI002AA63ADD|nr:ABC transporter substrate-binding protein [uncultured Desulfobacter sp.]